MATDNLLETAPAGGIGICPPAHPCVPQPPRSTSAVMAAHADGLFHIPPASAPAGRPRDAPARPTVRPRVLPSGIQASLFGASRIVVFDLETQRGFADVGGRDARALRRLQVSVAVCHDSATDTYRSFWEHEIDSLVALLRKADLVVGFNILGFDYPVLARYTQVRLSRLPTLDLMADLAETLGHRLPLDALVRATLGAPKSASGLAALDWWREGALDKLESYCQDDVRLTRALYEFGRAHGYVLYAPRGGGRPRRVPVTWR